MSLRVSREANAAIPLLVAYCRGIASSPGWASRNDSGEYGIALSPCELFAITIIISGLPYDPPIGL
ncbi:MAG: hypothetical protein Athens101410_580 [Parcubacteria group bacterium Athens1014_10]|nr:MAG: hypothetical protein Athens101410_580 [Parcubacteria group bacterium Athens1014_10]TSD04641.1 MAG: hypothetical protein Athens071412_708 [Parcubacteria group bacterium Athens0714_12]